MNNTTDPSRPAPLRRIAILGVLFVAAIMSCGKDVTGPLSSAVRYARGFSWSPIFPPAFELAGGTASGVVQFNRVHVVLHHDDGTIALDTVVDFPAGADSLTLSLTVKLLDNAPSTGEPMSLNLGYLDAAGDTVFKGGPISITAAPPPAGGGTNPPVQVPVSYTGPGSGAVAVVIAPRSASVVAGSGFSFTAIAKDNNGVPIAGTPIVWNSLDPSIATITSAIAGAGLSQNARGTARIVAQLLTGPADTVQVFVSLPASQIIAQSGNTQTGVVGTALAQPVVVKVAATDGVGVGGATVNFSVASGGGSVANSSVVSDANGLAQTTWKLGTATGTQSVTASSGSLTNSPLTFTATAQAATATKLVNTSAPANGVAGTPLGPVVFTAQDNNGNTATSFTGAVSVSFGSTVTGATLSGTTTVNAVAGVATFSTLAINKSGAGYTLVGAASGLPNDTTSTFNIAVGAPAKLVFTVQPSNATANAAITPAIVVNAQDSQGNPTPLFTGSVTLGFATNPASATLGGTASVNAVAGVATFSGITVSAAGTGYSLSAAATGLTSATSSLFNIGGGVAASIAVASGGAQTGAPSAALAQPIVIQVNDASANPVAGTTVNFAIVTGGGSVAPASGVSNAAGQVQTTWTLGAPLGAQSISATSTGLAGSPLTINATAASGRDRAARDNGAAVERHGRRRDFSCNRRHGEGRVEQCRVQFRRQCHARVRSEPWRRDTRRNGDRGRRRGRRHVQHNQSQQVGDRIHSRRERRNVRGNDQHLQHHRGRGVNARHHCGPGTDGEHEQPARHAARRYDFRCVRQCGLRRDGELGDAERWIAIAGVEFDERLGRCNIVVDARRVGRCANRNGNERHAHRIAGNFQRDGDGRRVQ